MVSSLNGLRQGALASVVITSLLLESGCSSESATYTAPEGPVVKALTATSISGTVGGTASIVPTIRITNARDGQPIPNVAVAFQASGATVASDHVVTNSSGEASAGAWNFGGRAGVVSVAVWVYGAPKITFNATLKPGAPAVIQFLDKQEVGFAGESLKPIWVHITDSFFNSISRVDVTFEITRADNTRDVSKSATDAGGNAIAKKWTSSAVPGATQITASIPGGQSASTTITSYDPAAMTWYRLETIGNENGSFSPTDVGIEDMVIGFTSFDHCLCSRQVGYYLKKSRVSEEYPYQSEGRFVLEGAHLVEQEHLEWANGEIKGDVLELEADDIWGGYTQWTWVYREIRPDER